MSATTHELPFPLRRRRCGLDLLLPDHHERIAALARGLIADALAGPPRDLVARWCDLEIELDDHMREEESAILPLYEQHAPADAAALREDHARIRRLLDPIGLAVELHELRVQRLQQLVVALETHALHEDTGMYPWAEHHLATVERHLLLERIGSWFGA